MAVKVHQLKEVNHNFSKLYNKAFESFNKLEMIASAQAKEGDARFWDRGKVDEYDASEHRREPPIPPKPIEKVTLIKVRICRNKHMSTPPLESTKKISRVTVKLNIYDFISCFFMHIKQIVY